MMSKENFEQLMNKAMFVYLQGLECFENKKLHNNLHLCSFFLLKNETIS